VPHGSRRGRHREEGIQRLNLAQPFDLVASKQMWLEALSAAETFAAERPPEEVGCLCCSRAEDRFVVPEPGASLKARGIDLHYGTPGGVVPQIVAEESGE
jgi:hypothetical protein